MLYGREQEQAHLTGMLKDARDRRRSSVLLLRGEAGIGKSALLGWFAESAEAVGDGAATRVLRLAGVEAEASMAFAGLNQLLWPVRDRIDALPAPQAAALRAALRLPGPAEGDAADVVQDRFTTGLALLTLLADLADDAAVLCLVDDAQWLDTATAEALLFAARRLAAEGVVMVFATRDAALTATGLPEAQLNRLEDCQARWVLAGLDLPQPMRDRIVREAAGNPLALLEFGAGRPGTPDGSTPLPVPDRVVAGFQSRIGALPESTRLMLLILAAEGRGHMPSLLGAARAFGVGLADLEEAERARLVAVTGTTAAFRHPLIRAASYQGAVAARRIAVHEALAAAAEDPDCRARHRASSALSADEDVAAELQRAAERAQDRTGHGVAAALFRQAAELTPGRHARTERLAAAARATLQAGQPAEADELAVRAAELTTDPAEHARLGLVRAAVEFERGDPRAAARTLVEHAAGAASADAPGLLRTAAAYAWTAGEAPAVLRAAELLRASGRDDETVQGMAHLVVGDYAHGLPLLAGQVAKARKALRSSSALSGGAWSGGEVSSGVWPAGDRILAARVGLVLGDDEAALELASAEAVRCRAQGLVAALPDVLQAQAQAQIAVGLHQDAEAAAAEAIALACDTGFAWRQGQLGTVLARIAAIEGDENRLQELTAATGTACAAGAASGGTSTGARVSGAEGPSWRWDAASARGLLDLGHGRYDEALRRFDEAGQRPQWYTASAMLSSADHVEAAVRAGHPEEARPVLERLRKWAQAGRQPWALAVVLRCEALLSDEEEPYAAAVRQHEQAMRPFERARTELLYGEWLRRARRRSDARVPLRSAVEVFERLRAAPWAERARAELRATGGTGTAAEATASSMLDRLTPQERQVVRLASEGSSSREIAAHLFLSPRTVEYHLYKAYPKLGISSRRELPRLRATVAGDDLLRTR
ncbi:AAA family ATPase [Actinomadura xylanilytica]|uniref:AAA family ATPase n=1 Tax=Actinomadura xylanilytica TaxID=887459 RepID=UPI00255B2F13|nr:LuxR family transcriptional regulator [Actinomadura xylanilytica]MDL4772929.1 AAA family ATPase [Actinomadura xylanilytica]